MSRACSQCRDEADVSYYEPQSTQAEVHDVFIADTGYHLCRGCRNIRVGAWSFAGLCSFCCATPRGGFRTNYRGYTAPLDPVPVGGYIPPGTAQPVPARPPASPPAR